MLHTFFANLKSFLKIIFKNRIYWNRIVSNSVNCKISKNVKLYNPHNLFNVEISTGTYISENARISYTQIGKYCSIGPNLLCGWGIHPLNGISTHPAFYSNLNQGGFSISTENKIDERKKIVIGNDVFLGANVTIIDGVIIGDGAVVGAGTTVYKNIPPYAIVAGSPMRIIRYRFDSDKIDKLLKLEWWNQNDEVLQLVEKYFFDLDSFFKILEEKNKVKVS